MYYNCGKPTTQMIVVGQLRHVDVLNFSMSESSKIDFLFRYEWQHLELLISDYGGVNSDSSIGKQD